MNEIWKDIPGYEGLYSASNLGRIKNYGRQLKCRGQGKEKAKVLIPSKDCKGYLRIRLVDKDGNRKCMGVHRIIALTFIPNLENKPYIDHINTIRDDNRVENLRWCTAKENSCNPISREKQILGLQGRHLSEEHKKKLSIIKKGFIPSEKARQLSRQRKLESAKPVIQLSLDGEFIKEWKSVYFASSDLGIDKSSIYKCISGKLHQTGGFKWIFK